MYIESVPNRNSPPAILLRESYRDAGKVRKRTLANLSKWPPPWSKDCACCSKAAPPSPTSPLSNSKTRSIRISRASPWNWKNTR